MPRKREYKKPVNTSVVFEESEVEKLEKVRRKGEPLSRVIRRVALAGLAALLGQEGGGK